MRRKSLDTLKAEKWENTTSEKTNELIKFVGFVNSSRSIYRIAKTKIPFKDGDVLDGFAIIPGIRPFPGDDNILNHLKNLYKIHERVEFLKLCTTDPSKQQKYVNTERFLYLCIVYLEKIILASPSNQDINEKMKENLRKVINYIEQRNS